MVTDIHIQAKTFDAGHWHVTSNDTDPTTKRTTTHVIAGDQDMTDDDLKAEICGRYGQNEPI